MGFVDRAVKMKERITFHYSEILVIFVFGQPVERVVGKQDDHFGVSPDAHVPFPLKIGLLELVGSHANVSVFAEALEAKQSGIESYNAHRGIL